MIDIIITGRNDDFGGPDFADRLCAAAEYNHRLLASASVPHAYTLVEWNPLPNRPLLSEIVRDRLPWWNCFLVVDPVWHRLLSTNWHLEFMEFFAKNAGIRRSTATAILVTNSDVFLSTSVVKTLASSELLPWTVYRAERVDIDRRVDWRTPSDDIFSNPQCHVRINDLTGPDYGNSAGDFLLMRREAWLEARGFNETVRFAKIHKDGQFCYKAWIDGLRFEVIGRIWHIDHEGSYANVKGNLSQPDAAPYGPEWDFRTNYRNPHGWGLASAVEEKNSSGIVQLRHPSTHGPILSVIRIQEDVTEPVLVANIGAMEVLGVPARVPIAAAVNEGLGIAHGRFLLIDGTSGGAATGSLEALVPQLDELTAELVLGEADSELHPTLGVLPQDGASFIFSRQALEAAGQWDEGEPDPAMAFWLRIAEHGSIVTLLGSLGVRMVGQRSNVRHGQTTRVLLRRGSIQAAASLPAAVRECVATLSDARSWLGKWLQEKLAERTSFGILGVDWATPLFMGALNAIHLHPAGIFSPDESETGTRQWGHRIARLSDLATTSVSDLFASAATPRVLNRLAEAGYRGQIHTLMEGCPVDGPSCLPSELDLVRDDFCTALRNGDADTVLNRLALLSELEDARRWTRIYDAAQCLEHAGRVPEAMRLFHQVASMSNQDLPLRLRALYHEGRILFEAGEDRRALRLLDGVLHHHPGHRKAWEHVEALLRRAPRPDLLIRSASSGTRSRWQETHPRAGGGIRK